MHGAFFTQIYSLVNPGIRRLRRSRWIHRLLFGYWPRSRSPEESWDWTTLVLLRALSRHSGPKTRLLDMGTGSFAVLAIHAQLKLGIRSVRAVDVVPGVIRSAQANADSAGATITCACSDLFDQVSGTFDVIVMNAPYIPVPRGRQLGVLRTDEEIQRFGGGELGDAVIRRFLAGATAVLAPGGRVILGVNHHHISAERVLDAIRDSSLAVVHTLRHRITGSAAYVLKPAQTNVSETIGTSNHGS